MRCASASAEEAAKPDGSTKATAEIAAAAATVPAVAMVISLERFPFTNDCMERWRIKNLPFDRSRPSRDQRPPLMATIRVQRQRQAIIGARTRHGSGCRAALRSHDHASRVLSDIYNAT